MAEDKLHTATKFSISKSSFILIYLLAISNFFSILPIGYLIPIGRGIIFLIFDMLWLSFGYHHFFRVPTYVPKLLTHSNNRFTKLFYVSIIPSIFMAYCLFGQSFLQSFISYRNLWTFMAIPVLLAVRPKMYELNKAIYIYAIMLFIVALLMTISPIQFYYLSEKDANYIDATIGSESGDFMIFPPGACTQVILISLYFYCVKLWKSYNPQSALKIAFYFCILVLMQNRSSLFPAALVIIITVFKCNIKPRLLKPIIVVLIISLGVVITGAVISNLVNQTTREMSTDYDPRIVAMAYFLDFNRMTPLEILFGTGNISFVTSNYVQDLQESHIHYSDVGFVGFWSQFGIMPILIFLYYLLKSIFTKVTTWDVKFTAIHILICSVTISYFESPKAIIWFVLFYYTYCYSKETCHPQINSKSRFVLRNKPLPEIQQLELT